MFFFLLKPQMSNSPNYILITELLLLTVPFMCSGGNLVTATGVCMELPSTILVSALEAVTASGALVGNIDSTSNMRNDRVWIYAGTHDSVVKPGLYKGVLSVLVIIYVL